jgi:hypothetical protein
MIFSKYFEKRKKIKEIKKKFLEEHKLPKYSPYSGIKIRWDIEVVQEGPYDTNTGEPLGEFKIIVSQRGPTTIREIQQDNRMYHYNTEEKELEVNEGLVWSIGG